MPTDDVYELLIIKFGEVETSRSQSYLNLHFTGLDDVNLRMDFYLWVARNDKRVVLIDTGFSEKGALSRSRRPIADPLEILDELGITPADVDTVVISHLHYDHAGNLGRFDSSRVVIAADEVRFWEGPYACRDQFAGGTDSWDVDEVARARLEGRLQTFAGRIEVAPGIQAIQVGGHTPGQSIVSVQTTEGEVVIASDAAHFYEELEHDVLFTVMADVVEGYRANDLLREREAAGALLLAGHDVAVFERFPAWQTGRLAGIVASIGAVSAEARPAVHVAEKR